MAFGKAAGPAASGRKVNELLELLRLAGHSDFRDARGPMGFNQQQAAGKFTDADADAFIEQLQESEHRGEFEREPEPVAPPAPVKAAAPTPATAGPKTGGSPAMAARSARLLPDVALATELRSRGWTVIEPA